MLILGVKPGHDGAIAALQDGRLLFSLEGEKDSFPRHAALGPGMTLELAELLPEAPDVIAYSGWHKTPVLGHKDDGAGYPGPDALAHRSARLFGKETKIFTSSHERSHIAMAVGMAPKDDASLRAVLCWEGSIGSFYLLDERCELKSVIPVMSSPGYRYGFVYALADETAPLAPRLEDAGKLMALAAFAKPSDAGPEITRFIDKLLEPDTRLNKSAHKDAPIYNVGVESELTKAAAAVITERIFEAFAAAARTHLPPGLPLYISGGCGLNCEWNMRWRTLGHFSSVFVPPCTNDSGSALGTAIDAQWQFTDERTIEWDVYSGLEFEWDIEPDSGKWQRRQLNLAELAAELERGRIVAWIQGRWEIGPRALGNRSILAEPFQSSTRDRLNEIKQREGYRPVAPCCRIEDAGKVYDDASGDPYMLYFRRALSDDLKAVTHVDGTARVQTVTSQANKRLHDLLSAFSERTGLGVLCNTSLNFRGHGFINRMSDLAMYCERRGIHDFVAGDAWFQRVAENTV